MSRPAEPELPEFPEADPGYPEEPGASDADVPDWSEEREPELWLPVDAAGTEPDDEPLMGGIRTDVCPVGAPDSLCAAELGADWLLPAKPGADWLLPAELGAD